MPVGMWVMRIAEFGLVDVLAAGAPGAHGLDTQIIVPDLDIDLLDLGHYGDRGGGCVDAPLRLGVRHALHPVHAGLELQLRERAAALHLGDDFLVAADAAFARRDHLDLPALQGREALVHPEQISGEQRSLVAAGAGADFQHHVAVVHGVLRQQRDADFLDQILDLRRQLVALGFRHGAHLGIGRGIGDQRLGVGELLDGRTIGFDRFDQWRELGELTRDLHIAFGGELTERFGFERGVMREQDVQFGFGE